jgi:flagellar hook-associated protein 1 FlgK
MRPTFLAFETAKKGLAANQKALDITGQNLANVNTAGYTRQRVDLVSVSSSAAGARFSTRQATLAGQGVNVKGVAQLRDSFLDKRFREEFCDVGYYTQTSTILEDIEAALDEVTSEGMYSAINSLRSSFKTLVEGADQVTNANIVLTAAKNMTLVLKQFDIKLNNILDQQIYDLNIAVNDVNSILDKIASLNESISKDIFLQGSDDSSVYGANELLDARNLLIDDLSNYGNISVTDNADGTIKIEMNGHVIMNGDFHDGLNMVRNLDDTVSLRWDSSGENVVLTSGALKGSLDMINGRGSGATGINETNTKGIRYYMDKIDTMARVIANTFNRALKVQTSDGSVEYKTLFVTSDGNVMDAGNITINADWTADPAYLINGLERDGEKDNTPFAKVLTLFDKKLNFGEFQGTLEEYVSFYNLSIGEEKAFNDNRLEASAEVSDDLLNRRDAISGVSIDEEGSNMMLYQKSYQAVARLMTALDEALDVLINSTGLVGR